MKSTKGFSEEPANSPRARVTLRVGEGRRQHFGPEAFTPEVAAALASEVNTAAAPATVEVRNLADWPDEARWDLLQFLKALEVPPTVRVAGVNFTDPFEAVLAAMTGPNDLTAHGRSIKAAIEAAALFHGDIPKSAAGRIITRVAEVGGAKPGLGELVQRINNLGDGGNPSDSGCAEGFADGDAKAAALAYLKSLSPTASAEGGTQPVLHYFRSEFYCWNGHSWERRGADQMCAQVTRWCQDKGADRISGRFVNDVLVNLRAATYLDCWREEPPFYIEATRPPHTSRRRLLVFLNGTLDLDAQPLGRRPPPPHDSRWFSEVVLPFHYHAMARCPRWRKFLKQVLPRSGPGDHRQEVLQEFFGYCLMNSCAFEKMLLLLGGGSNGKSVVLRLLSGMLGDHNVAHVAFDQLASEFRLASLVGKAVNVTMELNHLGRANEALLRSLVSGEPLTVNRKFLPPVTVRLLAKLVVACNELPVISDTTNGVWRRFIIVPFDVTITEEGANRRLADELSEELAGIFNWSLAGLRRLTTQNGFTRCERCEGVLAEYRRDSNSVAEFAAVCLCNGPQHEIHAQRLFDVYAHFCRARERKAVSAIEFGKRMKRLGFTNQRGSTRPDGTRPHVYRGSALTPAGTEWRDRCMQVERPGWHVLSWQASADAAPGPGESESGNDNSDSGSARCQSV